MVAGFGLYLKEQNVLHWYSHDNKLDGPFRTSRPRNPAIDDHSCLQGNHVTRTGEISKNLKILTLSYEFPPLGGGGSKVAHGLSAELVSMGHHVDVITMSYDGLPDREVVDGIHVYRVPCIRKAVDISFPHELASYMVGALPKAIRLCKRESYDLMHCHFILPDGLIALWLRRKFGIPLVVTAHGSDVPGYNPDRFKLIHRLISPVWRAIARTIDTIICPSRYLEDLIVSHEPKANTHTIPNGFDIERFNPDNARKESILVVTRMLRRKGVQDVLRALAEPGIDFEINIVGTGPYLDKLMTLDRELGTNATFHGWLENDSDQFRRLLEESSIFVFPSHAENFPLVLLEAMAAGAAIITTDQSGCREVVGNTALHVPPGDPGAIRKAIERLISDRALRERLGRAARERLEENFGWPSVTESHISTYLELISTPASHGT